MKYHEQVAFLRGSLWRWYDVPMSDTIGLNKRALITMLNKRGYGMDKKEAPVGPEEGASNSTRRAQTIEYLCWYLPQMRKEGCNNIRKMIKWLYDHEIRTATNKRLCRERFKPLFPIIAEQRPDLIQYFPEDLP